MKLELATFNVHGITFSNKTRLSGGILYVDPQELKGVVAHDPNFEDVQVDIVEPGEETRIMHVIDIVEPRFKVSGGTIFPGMLGASHSCGQGRTHRLSGVAVVETSEPIIGEPVHWREAIIDMSGPGALYSPFTRTGNIVLTFKPKPSLIAGNSDITGGLGSSVSNEYNTSVRFAGLKASAYLARVTEEMDPDRFDTYELKAVDISLPRIAVAYLTFRSRFFGESTTNHLATLVHPNEFMDGALVSDYSNPASSREFSYYELNNPIVSELYSRHGKDLNFVGALLYGGQRTQTADQERVVNYAAQLIELLAAQGVILVGMSESYHGAMVMFLCQKLERKGIMTTIVSAESLTSPGDPGFTHCVQEAVAMVSTGNWHEEITLPPMKKVVGGSRILETNEDATGSVNVPVRFLCGATDRLASGKLSCRQY